MAKRKSENFLPQVFRTLGNKRFLNATMDPLIQEPSLKKMYGYIGQQDQSPVYSTSDYYINENDSYSQFYQLEPGVVIKKRQLGTNTYKVNNVYNYVDLLNQLAADGGLNNNHDRLFTNRYYSYNGFVDLDKLTNYRQYYWVPGGPMPVDVTADLTPTQKDFYFHRVSYVANNETELQSAALGETGYSVDGYNNVVNPTITLVRGGSYNFYVNQTTQFWIQTEIGTSGTSTVQSNISTRDVLGVSNNGTESGIVTFTVPISTAQDYLINYPNLGQNVDIIVDDITYEELQGVNYDNFVLQYSLDGVRSFDGKYLVFTSNTGWADVDSSQWHGVWRINVDPVTRLMNLTYITAWDNLTKVFVNQGDVYGHVYAYKNNVGIVTKFPTLSAAQSVLYYVDAKNPLVYGTIRLVDPTPNSLLNVNDILGKTNYTSPNGVQFTTGLKVKFTGLVVPTEYQGNEYIIEGVGSSIKLIKYSDLVTPETINTNLGSSFGNSRGFDADGTGFDGTTNSPEIKDYITINRASVDGNSWSRNNRWFHRDVLQAAANYNNTNYSFDSNQQAKRPIVEFLPNLKLYNYGENFRGYITCFDSVTTSAFSQIEGVNSYAVPKSTYDSKNNIYVYNSDGIQLLNGVTVIFINDVDPTIRATLYQVQNNKTRTAATYNPITIGYSGAGSTQLFINELGNITLGQHVTGTGIAQNTTVLNVDTINNIVTISNPITSEIPIGQTIYFDNSFDQIHLVPIKTFSDGDTVVAMEGVNNQGNMYYYENGTWTLSQIRNSRPQAPLFDIVDANSISLSDQTAYPSSNFSGSKLFGYAVNSTPNASRDSELGFALVYKSIGNLGDIVFQNYYATDTFDYNLNQIDTVKNVNLGYAAVINSYNNYSFANGWFRVSDKTKQYISKVYNATAIQLNNFDLGVVYNNSYYENNIFVYINGVLQTRDKYTLQTSSITSVVKFVYDVAIGDRIFVKIYGTTAQYKQTYTMPRNLTNNSENSEFTIITLGQVRNHLIEVGNNLLNLVGQPAGANNFRDLNFNYVGGKLLQHSSSLRPASLLFANSDVDPIQIIRFAADSYTNFKNQLIDYINNREFSDPNNYAACLDTVLKEFVNLSIVSSPFYYTDMAASGNDYLKNTYTVSNTTYRSYNLTQDFSDNNKGYRSLLVYLNGVLLLKNIDYVINAKVITINDSVTLSRNDVIEVVEYTSTVGCNIPATPTKLGIYPKFTPQIVLDDSYVVPTTVIIGHDGSITTAYGDYRDNILLEFEKRVYNNITVTYANNTDYDLPSVVPGAFRKTDYSITEWTQLLTPAYLRWSTINNVNVFDNTTTTGNEFTWNYSSGVDKLFYNPVPGYWRGIYNYFYDTDRPHTHPWEMLGFAEKPTWWELRYGPAPYSSENNVLWTDLELGFVYGGNPNLSYINSRYSRPGLYQIIPVDKHGNLIPPNLSVITNYDVATASQNWQVGDQSPQETAWRRSVDFPFAVMIAWCLARPAEWCALKYNTRDLTYVAALNQIINTKTNNRIFDFTATSANDYIPGYNVWLRDYLTSNNLDVIENWNNVVNNSTFNLVYKMGAYTDKSYLTVVADQVSPQSTNSSVIIPQENYQVKVTKSAPVARAIYSAVIVQKVTNGFQITGFDKERPYFLTIPSRVSSNNYGIAVGNQTAIIYLDAAEGIITYPYGTIFNTTQQVVDFLISYGRYLESQGFSFNDFLSDNSTKSDWTLAAKEFLFWEQQDWGDSTVISLTPTGTSVNFNSLFGIVDTITNTNNYTKIINSDNVTLTGRDYRVYRDDNNFSVTLKNTQKGIHLLDIAIVQYEHTLIFDNNTVFNDILYDEQTGSRQFRLRIDGSKTQDWNGSLYAPGFFVNVSDIPQWAAYTDYYTGDIVLFKDKYYAAQKFIPGTQKFATSDWYLINGDLLSKNLIPNMASGAAQFINFHDPDATDLNSAADALSKSETGFSPRQYFTDLGLDNTSQYKFYLGMIAQKGTQAVLNAYLRNYQKRIDSNIKVNEQWAIKLDNYGGTNDNDKLEFNIGNATSINNQYLFQFINDTDVRSFEYNSVKPSDLLYKPRNYTSEIFSLTEPRKQIIPTAGPVNTSDVSATVFDISKIYNISALNSILGEGSKIWIAADSSNQWGVYRLSSTASLTVLLVTQVSPTELQFTTNVAHNLSQYDYIMLKNGKVLGTVSSATVVDLSGFYKVSSATNNTFNVKIMNNISIGTGALAATMLKLINVRYSTGNDFANFIPVRGWNTGEIVYIDNGTNGYNVLQNTNNWAYSQTKSPTYTVPSDNYGSSVKINHSQGFAIVGAPNKNTSGSAFIYGKRQDNTWQEIGILTPDSRVRGFGSNVDINTNDIAFLSAPTTNKGVVYTANVSSQQIKLTQAIHYDNLYVISAGISQSNAYLLISNVNVFDATANIAVQANYSLANFANGMAVAVPGANSTIQIANISYGYPYHKIGLTANLATLGLTISGSTKIAIYSNVTPQSQFGYSISASGDGNWLYVGEPTTNSVYVYKYNTLAPVTSLRQGDGVSTSFSYPSGATGSANDVKVYVDGALKIPYLDYIKTPGQNAITFDIAPAGGYVANVLTTSGGVGYYYGNTSVTFSSPLSGVTATGNVWIYPNTAIGGVIITNPGKGYGSLAPTATISSTSGSGAILTPVLYNANIGIVYESHWTETNTIVTDDPQVGGFGNSVSTNYDGSVVVIGAANSSATFSSTYNNAGKTYIYDRTTEVFVADGVKTTFQLSNALANLTTITTPTLTTNPTILVDGIIVQPTVNYSTNTISFGNAPARGSTIIVQTNQFINTKIGTTDVGQQNSNYGTTVKISSDGSSVFSAATGYGLSSSQNGVVFYLLNIPQKYGTAIGNKSNFTMAANNAVRINDHLVTFTGGSVTQTVNDINAAHIPDVTAAVLSNNAIVITTTDVNSTAKLRLRNEVGDPLNTMGIVQWQTIQRLNNPIAQDTAHFGEILSLSPDGSSLVVGSTLSNTKAKTTFDNNTTTFDMYNVKFIDTVYRSGAAHIYEYQTLNDENYSKYGSYAYGTLINDQFASSFDRYATGVDISDNFILIGAPQAKILGNQTGALYVYYNPNSQPIWQSIRSGGVDYDSRKIDRAYIYNSTTAKLIADLPVYDLTNGYLPNESETYLDFVINYDPAVYNKVPTTISFNYDRKNAWGKEKIGKLWWDINSIKYYDNTQGSTLERFNYWGLAFPASTVNVYEWVESLVPPSQYVGSIANNTPLYTINDVYSSQVEIDSSTGLAVTKYYFWVKNSTLSLGSRPSALEIQGQISLPRASSEPFAAVISPNAIALFNVKNLISIDTNMVIEYKDVLKPQLTHSEWTMFDDGTDLGVAAEFLNKLNDSLTGQDSSGRIVPDPKLPIGQRYGMDVKLRQSLFKDQYTGRKLFIENVNEICITYPMVLTRSAAISALNSYDPIPDSTHYKTVVANITELSYLDTNTYLAGDQVLVLSDSNSYNNGWSLYRLNVVFPNSRTWEIIQVQTYNLNNYWSYADWYSNQYNPQSQPKYTVATENDISNLQLNVNDIIYVTNSSNGGWKLVLVTSNSLELLAQQNATIQFTPNLYDLVAANQGFQTSSFQSVGFDSDSNLEFNAIFDIIRDKLLINEYRSNFKDLVKLMIDTIATQHQQTDWLMKTSLVDLYHRVRGLDQLPVYLPQPESTVTDFFSEAKPYHTKLKQYIATYDNTDSIDVAYNNVTDFDLQPYKNNIIKKYRSPQLGNSLDNNALETQSVYQPWLNNHSYGVKRVDTVSGGVGYDANTTVTIVGDGTGATAQAYVVNGSVYTITVTDSGLGYTQAKAYIFGVGTGATATVILGDGLARTTNTIIKYDRYTYFNNIQDWAAYTSYTVNTVVVYNAQPYRVITAHTSGTTFDSTKFVLLVVKVWYPQTEYALNDVVIYKNTSYTVNETFTSALTFDTANLTAYNGLWLDNACDRVWAYYAPKSGMAGRDLSQVMTGMEYSGNQVIGPNFNQTPGYDVNNYDYIAYDYETFNVENVADVYGSQAEDTYIQSLFTDTGLGLRPEDINIVGGDFYDAYSSHAPEEFVPGQVLDTLDIKVTTTPIANGGPDIKIFTVNYQGLKTFSFDKAITGVDYPVGGIEKFYIVDHLQGPLAESVDYSVNWQNKTISLNYTPQSGTYFYSMMIGSNGVNPVYDQDYYGDGVQIDFAVNGWTLNTVKQAYVKVNGIAVSNWSLVNITQNGVGTLAVRFATPPHANDYIQIHLYNVALGTRAYSEWYEQTFTVSNASYPGGYNFTLNNPEIYSQPISSYAIVRLNNSDLLPPQQSYYTGDGITTNYSLTKSWTETITNIVDTEIIVLVNKVLLTRNIDYTVYHDPLNVATPVIQFTTAPASGSQIIISDASQCDYRIYDGNQLWISQNVVIPQNSVITVLTQGNHDANNQYTKLFSGSTSNNSFLDNGLDSGGFDALGFDNELSNLIGQVYYTLPTAVSNINQIYITLKTPNTTGGKPLLPYTDYVLVNPTTIVLSSNLNISGASVITIRIFGNPIREHNVEFRIFKDMRDITRYYAVKNTKTILSANLMPNDNWVYVENVDVLQNPEPSTNTAGVVVINGERITYGVIDTINKRLGNLRRGTAGTGLYNNHVAGSVVYDSGNLLEIPNSRETYTVAVTPTYITNGNVSLYVAANSTIRQSHMFVNLGESMQTSNTTYAQFIRAQ